MNKPNDLTETASTGAPIARFDADALMRNLAARPAPYRSQYLAMYSTYFGGIVTDPHLMWVPIDDHVVHRGDGVFEAIKCVDGRAYALDRHLERLAQSAERLGLALPLTPPALKDACLQTLRVAGAANCFLRLYVTRGPGGFTANPYESVGSQFYLVITHFKPVPQVNYEVGVSAGLSAIGVKEGWFATVKSCNYLPNVLMKKEAVDRGLDFVLSVDSTGHLAEGSTENFAIVSARGELLIPEFSQTLRGITAVRAMELVQQSGVVKTVRNAALTLHDLKAAREAMFFGTTIDCLPVTTMEGLAVGDGRVGPVSQEIQRLLRADVAVGPLSYAFSTPGPRLS